MTGEHDIRTATMARIYVQQGHYQQAADIYRHLLELDPTRKDIAAALEEVRSMQGAQTGSGKKEFTPLLRQWIRLAVRCRQLRHLQQMKKHLSSIQSGGTSDL
jgi:hypothetical protein